MTLQPWWGEMTHRMLYHVGDEAHQRHHFRVEVERNLREIASTQQIATQAQIATLREGFDHLGFAISDLQDTLAWSLDSIAGAVEQLDSTLSWGLAEIAWRQEQTNQLLQDVLKTLRHPRGTQAEELRERGDELYQNALDSRRPEDRQRWIDLALQAYQEAVENNPADFSVFHSMGVILFFEKGNSDHALRCFREAAALAEPYSEHHAAMSWLYLSYVHRNRQELEEAHKATDEALTLDPDWTEARFQHSIHCALRERIEEMEDNLYKAIEGDPTYFPKAAADPNLLPISEVRSVLARLSYDAKEKASKIRDRLMHLINFLDSNVMRPLFEEQMRWTPKFGQVAKRESRS